MDEREAETEGTVEGEAGWRKERGDRVGEEAKRRWKVMMRRGTGG